MPNPGALFYSGINNPYNIYQDFCSETIFQSEIKGGYVLEFWFMIDNVIYTDFEINNKYNYFYAEPHEIYFKKIDNLNKKYYYQYIIIVILLI